MQVTQKRWGVFMYYKEDLLLIKKYDLCTLKECLVTEIRVDKKSFSFRLCIGHQVRLKMGLKNFVMT